LLALLGRGGMGEVWRALDTAANNRTVAIKLLPPNLAQDDTFVERFRREAEAAAQLNNPHVIPIHNYGEIDGRLYVDMRLVEGRDLQRLLASGPLDPGRAVRIIEQVARALHAAHQIGLVHRDVKPSNILVDDDDFAYLIDFGIARGVNESSLTSTGSIVGSFHYMAPERFRSHEPDARADIYALACVLYECLTGSRPFPGDNAESQVAAHLTDPPPQLSAVRPNVPTQFDAVIAKGMAKDPDARHATTVEFAREARDAVTAPIARSDAETVVIDRSPPSARASATAVGARWWRRKSVVIPAAVLLLVVLLVVVGVAAMLSVRSGRDHVPTATAPPPTTAPPSTTASPSARNVVPPPFGAQATLPFTDLASPFGVAVDAAGTVQVADADYVGRVLALPRGSDRQTTLPFAGLGVPKGVAVDTGGSVFVTDQDNSRVLMLARGSAAPVARALDGAKNLNGVAVDAAGNIYVADSDNSRVLKLPVGSDAQEVLPFSGLELPVGVAVDTAGSVYVADSTTGRVVTLRNGRAPQEVLAFTGLAAPAGVAVDSTGGVYVSDQGNRRVVRLASGSTEQEVLPFSGLVSPWAVTVDDAGSVYATDVATLSVVKLPTR
jgi:serine/threonine-protein kinase